jgi:hypothetical protein
LANFLTNYAQQIILEMAFRGGPGFATLDFGLTDATLDKTSVLADAVAGEVAGFGYARVTIPQDGTGFPTSALDAGDWQLTSEDIVFTASGGSITPFSKLFCTDAVGLIGVWDLSATIITDGNSLTYDSRIKLATL